MNKYKSQKGAVLIVILLIISLLAGGGSIYEIHKAHEKNTDKAVVATVTDVETAKQVSDALAIANAKADAAQKALEKSYQDQNQQVAGIITGAKISLDQDNNPSIQSKISETLIDNALTLTGPATSSQITQFTQVIKDLETANAKLVEENINLKNINIQTSQSLNQVGVENAQIKNNLDLANKANNALSESRDAAVKQTTIANNLAATNAKQIEIVNQSWETRLKEYILGFGVFPLILICALLPLIGMAFPAALPVIKFITAPFLKLWHTLYDKLIAIEQKATANEVAAHAVTKTALLAEQAAHAATKSTIAAIVANTTTAQTQTTT